MAAAPATASTLTEQDDIKLDITEQPNTIPCTQTQSPQPIFGTSISRSFNSILTEFHAGYFRITLSLGGQAFLWKTLMSAPKSDNLVHSIFRPPLFLAIWSLSLFTLVSLSLLYALRCFFYFDLVKSEFVHHVGVNYLFAPWISWLLLLQSSPFIKQPANSYLCLRWRERSQKFTLTSDDCHHGASSDAAPVWWFFVVPIVALDLKIYGQWFTKGKRFLSTVANPTSQMSVIGNLVGAQVAAEMGWRESAICLFSLGMVHYLVLFVTLYQQLSGGERLPAMLRPVFFLFFAAPSVASLAWGAIAGDFDTSSKMLFFLSFFLFTSLACRPMLFKRSMRKFNVAWWAYSFPLTVLALASAQYAEAVRGDIAYTLMLLLLALSILVAISLTILTLFNSKLLLRHASSSSSSASTS